MPEADLKTDSGSPEAVAFKLLQSIAMAEKRTVYGISSISYSDPDRDWILSTYATCLSTVRTAYHEIKPK